MSDDRRFPGLSGVRFAWLVLVLLAGCDGEQTITPALERETVADTAPMSDFVSRPLPNPTSEVILNWAPLPNGREWGTTAGIDIDPDGHLWAYDRCGG